MSTDPWVVMPVLAHPTYTEAAISDCLAQTWPCRVLVVNQGVATDFRRRLEKIAEDSDRLFVWSHQPPLPSLAATWNRALEFCWQTGAHEALVVNNDVRLAPNTLELLHATMGHTDALVVTGVGVSKQQFIAGQLLLPVLLTPPDRDGFATPTERGGPDFSCFLINHACHQQFQFDERFMPAYCEDVDFHRRLLLAGAGRRIFGVNVPYLHYGSVTLKTVEEKTRLAIEQQTAKISRTYYVEKWGGPVNEERYLRPFDPQTDAPRITTPDLQWEVTNGQDDRRAEAGRHADRADGVEVPTGRLAQ